MPATVPDVEDQFDDDQAQVPVVATPPVRFFPCPFFHV